MSVSTPTVSRLTKTAISLIKQKPIKTICFEEQIIPALSLKCRKRLFTQPTEEISLNYVKQKNLKFSKSLFNRHRIKESLKTQQDVSPVELKPENAFNSPSNAVSNIVLKSSSPVYKNHSPSLIPLPRSPTYSKSYLDVPTLVNIDTVLSSPIENSRVISESPHVGYELNSPLLKTLCESSHPKDVQLLGRGTFGCVYFVLERGERRAVKIAEKSNLQGDSNAYGLQHPNVASILQLWNPSDCGPSPRVAVMEYGGSLNLHAVLLNQDIFLSSDAKNSICIQIVKALEYCHELRIVHLDLKPANILVSVSTGVCKLSDFGCSVRLGQIKKRDQEMQSQLQCAKRCGVMGTAAYVAPELFQGHPPSTAADIYSLGILLHQVETRKVPFEGLHPHTVIYRVVSLQERPALPFSLVNSYYWDTVVQCWHANPGIRPSAKSVLLTISNSL